MEKKMNNSYSAKSPHKNALNGILKNFLRIVPDRLYLSIRYRKKLNSKCNFKSPKTFNEKMQWLKLHDRKPLYTDLSDKIKAKEIVTKLLGEDYVIPTIAVFDNVKDIDLGKLPDRFVLKCNHDCGSVNICRDKSQFDIERVKKSLKNHLKYNYYNGFREWPYKKIKRRIFAEKYVESEDGSSMVDYKFFCFNGEPKFLYVSQGLEQHSTASVTFFDLDGNKLPFKRSDFKTMETFKKPDDFEEMKRIAKKLAEFSQTKFIRIDLYTLNHKIYFSEFTFFPCAGFLPFVPIEADKDVGDLLKL